MEDFLRMRPQEETQKIISFIQEVIRQNRGEKLVIGLSGGVDSATSLTLAVRAIGPENIIPVLLPYGQLNVQGETDARGIILKQQITGHHVLRIDITPFVDQFIALDQTINTIRKGNIMARLRMIHLFDQAKKNNALVLGTENKTEHLLGYFTRFGDSASDIEPLIHLYKTQVRELAAFLGVPQKIIIKHPTADLWEGQTDEGEFGFSYEDADRILSLSVDRKKTEREIIEAGFSPEVVQKVLGKIKENKFKHIAPYTLFHS